MKQNVIGSGPKSNIPTKLMIALAFILLASVVGIVLLSGPMVGYKPSEYNQYPDMFWVSLYGLYSIGVSLAIWGSSKIGHAFGVFFALASQTILVSVPAFLGYFTPDPYDGTVAIGYVRSIELTKHASPGDFYPAFHVLMYTLVRLTNLTVEQWVFLSVPLMYIIYLVGVFFLVKELELGRNATLAAILASPMVYTLVGVVVPRTFLFSVFPIFLLVVYKATKERKALLLFLLMISMTSIAHPLSGDPFVAIPVLLLFLFAPMNTVTLSGLAKRVRQGYGLILGLLFLTSSEWWLWTVQFSMFYPVFDSILTLQGGATGIGYVGTTLASSHLSLILAIEVIAKEFGGQIVYALLGVTGSLYILYRLTKKKSTGVQLFAMLLFTYFSLWTLVLMLLPGQFIFWRFTPYIVFASVIVVATFASNNHRTRAIILIVVLTLLSQAIGLTSIYSSAWTSSIDPTTTIADSQSVAWLSGRVQTTAYVQQLWFPAGSMAYALFGSNLPFGINSTVAPNRNLDYRLNGAIFYLPSYSAVYYQIARPNSPSTWEYTPNDVANLYRAPKVCVIYSNPDISILVLGC